MKLRSIALVATLTLLLVAGACSSDDKKASSSTTAPDKATTTVSDSTTTTEASDKPTTTKAKATAADTGSAKKFCALLAQQAADLTDQMAKDPASIDAKAFLDRAKTQNAAALEVVPGEIKDDIAMMYKASQAALEAIANQEPDAQTQAALGSKEFKAAAERFKTWRGENCTEKENATIGGLSETGA